MDAFSPLTVGPLTLRNRFIRSGANEMMSRGTVPTRSLLEFHRRLAAGGVGMTTLAYVAVSPDGRTFGDQGVISAQSLADYASIADAVHAAGARISMQITHAGSFTQIADLSTRRAMSASGGIDKMGLLRGRVLQRAMSVQDMNRVRDEFVQAAQLARQAGFDAVEIHMGHGYLLNQFVSPLSNHRHDRYGGSAENRIRFPAEVLSAVKDAVGADLAVLAKINLHDGAPGGATADDALITARALAAAGADLLVLSGGRNLEAPWAIFHSPMPLDAMAATAHGWKKRLQFAALKRAQPKALRFRPLYFLEAARQVRAGVSCALGYVGGATAMPAAQQLLDEGFDAIVMARALTHDPALVTRFAGNPQFRSTCDACNRCVASMYSAVGTHCVVTGNALPAEWNRVPARAAGQLKPNTA